MIELPTKRVQDYLTAFGAIAVYAATCDGRPTAVAAALDPARSVRTLARRIGLQFEPSCIVWLPSRAQAYRIVQGVRSALPAFNGLLDVDAGEAEHTIRQVLRGTVFTEHSVVMARAKRNAERLDAALAQAQERGQLKFFNHAYRQYRQQAMLRGMPVLSYQQARTRLRRVLIDSLEWDGMSPAIVQRVLPRSLAFFAADTST